MAGTASAMLDTYPADLGRVDRRALARCIEAYVECSQPCTACADACLSEPAIADLTKCIRSNLDCADICDTAGRVLSRHTGYRCATVDRSPLRDRRCRAPRAGPRRRPERRDGWHRTPPFVLALDHGSRARRVLADMEVDIASIKKELACYATANRA